VWRSALQALLFIKRFFLLNAFFLLIEYSALRHTRFSVTAKKHY
jgi:hypothetical protein